MYHPNRPKHIKLLHITLLPNEQNLCQTQVFTPRNSKFFQARVFYVEDPLPTLEALLANRRRKIAQDGQQPIIAKNTHNVRRSDQFENEVTQVQHNLAHLHGTLDYHLSFFLTKNSCMRSVIKEVVIFLVKSPIIRVLWSD